MVMKKKKVRIIPKQEVEQEEVEEDEFEDDYEVVEESEEESEEEQKPEPRTEPVLKKELPPMPTPIDPVINKPSKSEIEDMIEGHLLRSIELLRLTRSII